MSTVGHDRTAGERCDATAAVYPGQAPGTIPLHCCSMAAWVANQEREAVRRRALTGDQVQMAGRMKDAGVSGRKIAQLLKVNEKTARNALKAGTGTSTQQRLYANQTRGNMTNRNMLLGRSKPSERLTREEIAALDKATVPPASPAPPPKRPKATGKTGGGHQQRTVRRDLLKFRWSLECPGCGFKVNGEGQPQPGQRLARCGRCKVVLVLGGG